MPILHRIFISVSGYIHMSTDNTTMDDLIVLGEAVPDELKDGRKVVCTACYSPKHGLVRIYPISTKIRMRRWDRMSILLEKNPRDTRVESWKVQGSKPDWDKLGQNISSQGQLKRRERIRLLRKLYNDFGAGCIEDLNDAKRSLAIIKPNILKGWMADRSDGEYDPTVQITLDSNIPFLTIRNYPKQPRVQYKCSNCRTKNPHNQQILEWGVYEWMRKNPENMEKGIENLRLTDTKYDIYFLVGNMAAHRNAFMVISVFRFKRGV